MSEIGLEIDLLTLFPQMLEGYLGSSMLGRAQERGFLRIGVHDFRRYAKGPHSVVDDRPFGGGAGMVLKPEPLADAVKDLRKEGTAVVYLCPDGEPLSPGLAKELSEEEHLLMVSGHYEGVDERFRQLYVDREVSIGDYILTNGTLAAGVVIDAVSRFVPGVLGEEKSLTQESFSDNLLSFPQYTRPASFEGLEVPEVLLSGNHEAIAKWRHEQQILRTKERRPDLILKDKNDASDH